MYLVVDQAWLVTADLVLLFIYLLVWLFRFILEILGVVSTRTSQKQ